MLERNDRLEGGGDMQVRKILIADPSAEFCQILCDMLCDTFQTVHCQDGLEALELLDRDPPHLLVTDLTLPGVDGLSLLRSATAMSPRPACLVTTRFLSPYIENALCDLAVDYVMRKPCDIQAMVERITDLAGLEPAAAICDPSIANTLINLDVSPCCQGFSCLELAVALYLRSPGLSMTKELYPAVGLELDRSPSSVERSIRGCIHRAWDHRNEKIWRLYFRPDRHGHVLRPTNSAFVAAVAEHLRQIETKK